MKITEINTDDVIVSDDFIRLMKLLEKKVTADGVLIRRVIESRAKELYSRHVLLDGYADGNEDRIDRTEEFRYITIFEDYDYSYDSEHARLYGKYYDSWDTYETTYYTAYVEWPDLFENYHNAIARLDEEIAEARARMENNKRVKREYADRIRKSTNTIITKD